MKALHLCAVLTALLGLALPAQAADPLHDPVINCAPPVEFQPLVAVFTGEAHAPAAGHLPPVSLTVSCRYFGEDISWQADATSTEPVVTVAETAFLQFDLFVNICESGSAVYADGHVATVPERCRVAPVEVDAGPLPETAPSVRCDHTRGPSVTNTWIVEAAAVAGARSAVPISTVVSCTVRDGNGVELTAGATAVGGAAAASNAVRAYVAPLVSKCSAMTVQYLPSGTTSISGCEYF